MILFKYFYRYVLSNNIDTFICIIFVIDLSIFVYRYMLSIYIDIGYRFISIYVIDI